MARSSSIGGIFAELTLRDGKFRAGMKSAGATLKKFGSAAVSAGAMAGSALAAGLAVGVKKTIDMGGALTDLSAQTGIAIKDLMQIQQAYKDNGKSADDAGKDINKMQKAIASAAQDEGGAGDPFAKLGLSASRLLAMDPASQFFTIAESIRKIQNPAEKTAAAMAVFGKSGGELLAVFEGADLESVNASLGRMPEIMQEFSAELDHAGDLLGRLPNKSDQFFAGFTAGVINELIPSLETVDNYDFTTIGESLGNSLGKAIEHAAFLFNVLFDTISGEGYAASIAKYAEAQRLIDEEQEQAKADRKKKADDEKAYDAARRQEHMNAPDWVDPYLAAREMEHRTAPDYIDPETIKPARITPRMTGDIEAPGIDDYQRRGLSLSASPQAQEGKKMLTVMEQVRNILNDIKNSDKELAY